MREHLASVAAIAATLIASSADAAPNPVRQAELLHRLKHDCGSCHGLTLKGGLGPTLLPAGLGEKDPDGLAAIVLDGVRGTPMPPWRAELTPEEARWLVDRLLEGVP